jgi:hypothetical protein
MFQIKGKSSVFTFQLDFSGNVAEILEEMPKAMREELIGNLENLFKALGCLVSGVIVVPSTIPSVLPKIFKALGDVTMEAQKEMHEVQKDEMEFVANGKTSSKIH